MSDHLTRMTVDSLRWQGLSAVRRQMIWTCASHRGSVTGRERQNKYIISSCTVVSIRHPLLCALEDTASTMHAFLFSVLALAKLISATNDLSPVIDLGYAQYQGSFDSSSNISYFLGVRYAQPPTGEYRVCSLLILQVLTAVLGNKVNFAGAHRRRLLPLPACSKRLSSPTNATSPTMVYQARILTGHPQVSRRGLYLRMKIACF